MNTSLIFVYNASSNPLSGMFDLVHRFFNPATFRCRLCTLTHRLFTEKTDWKEFRSGIGMPMEFLNRDKFEKKYDLRFPYPAILRKNANIDVLVSKREIDAVESLDGLIAAIRSRLAALRH